MKNKTKAASLVCTTKVKVRFSEVDTMRIVWHGNYLHYFEDGREAFGLSYPGLGYMDFEREGYPAPVVDVQVQYKSSLKAGETALVETRYINTEAAKICFEYVICRESDGEVVATGSTMQVFTDMSGELQLTNPAFYLEWKERWNVK